MAAAAFGIKEFLVIVSPTTFVSVVLVETRRDQYKHVYQAM